jgi:hypothetical protein
LRTANDVQEFFQQNSLNAKNPVPFNPNFTIEKNSRIAKLVAYSSPAHLLKQAGLHNLNAEKLAENGIVLQDLRNYRRYASDLPIFFQTIHHLVAAGFTRFHFDSRLWSLKEVAAAYVLDPVPIAGTFGMTTRDLLAADVKPQDLKKYNVKMTNIMADSKPFELLFALRMTPLQLQKEFGFQPAHLFDGEGNPRLSSTQVDILHTFCNWTEPELRKMGFNDEQVQTLKIAPQLNLESIKRAVLSSSPLRMRK